jgi:hypothetical protein
LIEQWKIVDVGLLMLGRKLTSLRNLPRIPSVLGNAVFSKVRCITQVGGIDFLSWHFILTVMILAKQFCKDIDVANSF